MIRGAVLPRRHWLVARLTPMTETLLPGRLMGTVVRLAIWVFLASALWRALYARTPTAAGVTYEQAVTYAVLAAMVTHLRVGTTTSDTVADHVYAGTILYWFVRPMSPRRYHLARSCGEIAYAMLWLAAGYTVCLSLGVVAPPVSAQAAVTSAVSLLLGQVIAHQLRLVVDLLCFWTVMNRQLVKLMEFVQTLLAGGFAPLWFFPDWFRTMSSVLPFQGIISVPMSIYTGRVPMPGVPGQVAVQVAWVAALAVLTRWMWARAARRVLVQGG